MIEWRPVKGYEGLYEVSNTGEVRSLPRKYLLNGKVLRPRVNNRGYEQVSLCKYGNQKNHSIHRLVAEVFLQKPEGKDCVNHINGDKSDNRDCNLEWCTWSENTTHAYKTGLNKGNRGEQNYKSKLTKIEVDEIRKTYTKGCRINGGGALAKKHNVTRQTINDIINNKIWKGV